MFHLLPPFRQRESDFTRLILIRTILCREAYTSQLMSLKAWTATWICGAKFRSPPRQIVIADTILSLYMFADMQAWMLSCLEIYLFLQPALSPLALAQQMPAFEIPAGDKQGREYLQVIFWSKLSLEISHQVSVTSKHNTYFFKHILFIIFSAFRGFQHSIPCEGTDSMVRRY